MRRFAWEILRWLGIYLGIALGIWLVFTGIFAGMRPSPASPLYLPEKTEMMVAFRVMPIIALLWPLWVLMITLLGKLGDKLTAWIKYLRHWREKPHLSQAIRHIRELGSRIDAKVFW